jgi:anti-anti-sigma factor
MNLTVTIAPTGGSATLCIAGDLDFETTGRLVDAVSTVIAEQLALREIHLDFTDLTFCDSVGLSGLIRVHRRAVAAGVQLHLDERPAHLNRILDVTGTLEYLTTMPASSGESGIG